jgi:hypothetical protein
VACILESIGARSRGRKFKTRRASKPEDFAASMCGGSSVGKRTVLKPGHIDAFAPRSSALGLGTGLLLSCALAALPAAGAEVYWQPIASISAEADTNLDLQPDTRQDVEGYLADFATVITVRDQTWNTLIKPRLQYDYYPQDSPDDRLEAFLDLNSAFKTQRSSGTIAGSFRHVEEFNAEFTSAAFNDINPVQPTNPTTGQVVKGESQDSVLLYPDYAYKLTPLLGLGVSGVYQDVTYSPAIDRNHLDFDYYLGRAFVSWSFCQRSDMQFGLFGTKFQAPHADAEATGGGATVDLTTNWSPIFSTHEQVLYQHTDVNNQAVNVDGEPEAVFNGSVGRVGGSVDAVYKAQVSQFRLSAGRAISPSGAGALYTVDKVQFQYNRYFGPRLYFTGAVIGLRNREINPSPVNDNRNYAQGLVDAKWMVTRTWFVQGGYQYQWQKYTSYPDLVGNAENNRIYIRIGYQGLPPP